MSFLLGVDFRFCSPRPQEPLPAPPTRSRAPPTRSRAPPARPLLPLSNIRSRVWAVVVILSHQTGVDDRVHDDDGHHHEGERSDHHVSGGRRAHPGVSFCHGTGRGEYGDEKRQPGRYGSMHGGGFVFLSVFDIFFFFSFCSDVFCGSLRSIDRSARAATRLGDILLK